MGGEKDTTRGGFFQLFDWTAKSRKKLFPSKSELPERSKQGKKSHGNLPMTRLNLVDEDDIGAGSSIRGGSDYSCASSVTDEEGCGSKAPNVVARLMGLDSLPMPTSSDPFFDTQSLNDVHYHSRNLGFQYESMVSGNLSHGLAKDSAEPRPQRIMGKPIEKFQTEMLPPKSAKSIPVTHHKLMSPIKSHGYIPAKNAAHIMEAAARIIEGGTHVPVKGKMPLVGSSSAPIRVRDLKEKVEATQRTRALGGSNSVPLKVQDVKGKVGATHKPSRPTEAAKNLKDQSLNKSWNGTAEAISVKPSVDGEEGSSSSSSMNKSRSISLAIQAKVNVQKREGLHTNGSRSSGGLKEDREVKSTQPFKSQRVLQKNSIKKSCNHTVLRQNNQKQNSQPGKDRLPSKPLVSNSKGRKVQSVDPSCGRARTNSSKSAGSSRSGSRKLGLGEMDNETEVLYSGMKNHPRKKRSLSGKFNFEKSQVDDGVMEKSRETVQYNPVMDRHFNWDEDSRTKGMDVVSFTFTAPLARSGSEATATFQGKRAMLDSDCRNLSSTGYNVIGGGDALSVLLEQKLKELSYGVECSRRDSIKLGSAPSPELNMHNLLSTSNVSNTTSRSYDARDQHALQPDNLSCQYDAEFSSTEPMLEFKQKFQFQGADVDARKFFDFRHTSPVSVLETSLSAESCNYSDNADSNSTEGSKPWSSSSIQAHEVSKKLHSADYELSDSASSNSCGTMLKGTTYLDSSNESELEYVNDMLRNIDLMFRDLSLGRVENTMNPLVFDQLESQRGDEGKVERKLLFECVSECLDSRCRQYVGGGCRAWMKGVMMVKRKECLAEEVCKEIWGWRGMGECMVDEIVDKDMSCQFGRWLDYQVDAFQIGEEIELQIFNSLVEEVFADVLLF